MIEFEEAIVELDKELVLELKNQKIAEITKNTAKIDKSRLMMMKAILNQLESELEK